MKRFLAWTIGIVVAVVVLAGAAWVGIGYFLSPQADPQKADAIVVVSGGQTTTRAEKGIELYKEGWAPKLIFSGAALDDGPSNAYAMRDEALLAGVPPRDIYIDEKSQNTYQNAENTKFGVLGILIRVLTFLIYINVAWRNTSKQSFVAHGIGIAGPVV